MECPGPREILRGQNGQPFSHLVGRFVSKRQRQNLLRRDPTLNHISDPMGNDARFSASGSREDQQWTGNFLYRGLLSRIERVKQLLDGVLGHGVCWLEILSASEANAFFPPRAPGLSKYVIFVARTGKGAKLKLDFQLSTL